MPTDTLEGMINDARIYDSTANTGLFRKVPHPISNNQRWVGDFAEDTVLCGECNHDQKGTVYDRWYFRAVGGELVETGELP